MQPTHSTPTIMQASPTIKQGEALIGYIQGFDHQGLPEVVYFANNLQYSHSALTTIPLTANEIGRNAVLNFIEGNPDQPIIIGLLHHQPVSSSQPPKPTPSELNPALAELNIEKTHEGGKITMRKSKHHPH